MMMIRCGMTQPTLRIAHTSSMPSIELIQPDLDL
ncbi:hypothetical protein PSPO01_15228 [Paraphaeosphaeria sporulosa]